ncbi:MAG: hypothetical protein ACWGPN_11490, partial [Gammaproteobacteria bacterium]
MFLSRPDGHWSDPIGKRAVVPGSGQNRIAQGRIIGVVSDFNFQSLHTSIAPIAMYPFSDDFSAVAETDRPIVRRFLVLNIA